MTFTVVCLTTRSLHRNRMCQRNEKTQESLQWYAQVFMCSVMVRIHDFSKNSYTHAHMFACALFFCFYSLLSHKLCTFSILIIVRKVNFLPYDFRNRSPIRTQVVACENAHSFDRFIFVSLPFISISFGLPCLT